MIEDSMHRPLTILGLAVVALGALDRNPAARGAEVSTTVYVGKHFEVREHDQPVKYVFNREQRVARVTGTLQSPVRVQRLRLRAGWNCVSIGVTATNLIGQLNQPSVPALIEGLYQWNPVTHLHEDRAAGQAVAAGAVLWVNARVDAIVGIVGTASTLPAARIPAGGGFIPARGFASWSPAFPVGVMVWKHEPQSGTWEMFSTGDLAAISAAPPQVAPGEAIYVQSEESIELTASDSVDSVLYYHSDHLGSTGIFSDQTGQATEETAYYAFGGVRHLDRAKASPAHYGFTQKERDVESGLSDFGHRFYHAGLGRWLSPDPLGERGGGQNLYAYVNQNPLKYLDPDGAEITITPNKPKNPTHYAITMKVVLIDNSSKKFSQTEMNKYADRIEASLKKNFSIDPKSTEKIRWNTSVNMRVVTSWKDVKEDDHVFQIVDQLNSAGETTTGGMLMKIRVNRFTQPHPDEVDKTLPANKHYTMKNFISLEGTTSHEMGHAGGLFHDDTHDNLMQQGSEREFDNQIVNRQMIQKMFKAYQAKELNKPQEELIRLRSGK